MINFTLIQGNDWEGLYLNGLLITQNHRLSAREILRAMIDYKLEGRLNLETKVADEDWLCDEGGLPELLINVKFVE